MIATRKTFPRPPELLFASELEGIDPIEPDLSDADLRPRMVALAEALGKHAPEDRGLELYFGRLPDSRLALVPVTPFAGAAYAVEIPHCAHCGKPMADIDEPCFTRSDGEDIPHHAER